MTQRTKENTALSNTIGFAPVTSFHVHQTPGTHAAALDGKRRFITTGICRLYGDLSETVVRYTVPVVRRTLDERQG